MKEAVVHLHPAGPLVALLGNPNCGKTALFNLLTGSRQKVANYAGVTVERKEGLIHGASGKVLRLLDLPGTYGLYPRSLDERVAVDVLNGRFEGEKRPDLVVCVVDATNLRRGLRLVLALRRLGLPCVVALNMMDLARDRDLDIDVDALARELRMPVVPTVAVHGDGASGLLEWLDHQENWRGAKAEVAPGTDPARMSDPYRDHERVRAILARLGLDHAVSHTASDRIDRFVLHPLLGPVLLVAVLFMVFQAVFAWAELPMDLIDAGTSRVGALIGAWLPEGWLRSLLVDGIVAGVGGVLVFLPQIVILFFFILVLEDSGYLPRAAFILDRLMSGVGLSGRSFIPLLSSFACAIPGIMATRTIANPRDRIVTILIAPLMTCSARLPVYALLIGAFVPSRQLWGGVELQGLVLFALYLAGIASAMLVAWVLKLFTTGRQIRSLMMELPSYHWPNTRNIVMGLWQRVTIFLRRVGGIILVLTIVLWFMASFPAPPAGATGAAIEYSLAGHIGHLLAPVFAPLGFNWQMSIALVPGLAAREVAVSALGTVYALSGVGDATEAALTPLIAHQWSLATGLSFMAWYVFAPMCLSTLITIRRETGRWMMALIAGGYLFLLAYLAAWLTFQLASVAGL
ncbi:MAG: ferrous iron transport protein B [Burkholderiaceae bacterium]